MMCQKEMPRHWESLAPRLWRLRNWLDSLACSVPSKSCFRLKKQKCFRFKFYFATSWSQCFNVETKVGLWQVKHLWDVCHLSSPRKKLSKAHRDHYTSTNIPCEERTTTNRTCICYNISSTAGLTAQVMQSCRTARCVSRPVSSVEQVLGVRHAWKHSRRDEENLNRTAKCSKSAMLPCFSVYHLSWYSGTYFC